MIELTDIKKENDQNNNVKEEKKEIKAIPSQKSFKQQKDNK